MTPVRIPGKSTIREHCGLCGCDQMEQVLDLGDSPLADSFPATPDTPEAWYPLILLRCRLCSLIQLSCMVDNTTLFGHDYGFFTGSSPALIEYYKDYAAWALTRFTRQAQKLTVEIACNDGTLLRHFRAAGCRTVGVDPSASVAEAARLSGLDVVNAPFGIDTARQIRDEYGHAGLVIANNVIAHVSDLYYFLAGVRDLLADDGVAIFECQDLDRLVLGNQFDHIYHEHRFYFNLDTLYRTLAHHGLKPMECIPTPQQGGSLRVTAVPFKPVTTTRAAVLGPELAAYHSLQYRADQLRTQLREYLAQVPPDQIAGYGATAKSTTLLNWCGIDLSYIADLTPAKIGRFSPGRKIPIVAPPAVDQAPDIYLLLAWNYLPGVVRREREYLDRGGRFLIPIPQPVMI